MTYEDVVEVNVGIDTAREHQEPRGIHHLIRLLTTQRPDGGDLLSVNGYAALCNPLYHGFHNGCLTSIVFSKNGKPRRDFIRKNTIQRWRSKVGWFVCLFVYVVWF